jgi:hypothetical protein
VRGKGLSIREEGRAGGITPDQRRSVYGERRTASGCVATS